MSTNKKPERFWEIDFVRGIAIVLMVTLHFFIDRQFLKMDHYQFNWNLWIFWQKITAALFLILVGVSLTVSRLNAVKFSPKKNLRLFNRFFKRGIMIFSLGLIITLVTKFYLGEGFIIFGVLHFIGIAIIFSYPFLTLRVWNIVFGLLVVAVGIYLSNLQFPFPWLLWAGLMPPNFESFDYFPIFPWFGVVLFGLALGNILYSQNGRSFMLYDLSNFAPIKYLIYLGKNSLVIYLIHQPLFILLLTVTKVLQK